MKKFGFPILRKFSKFTNYAGGGLHFEWKKHPGSSRLLDGFTLIELLIVVSLIITIGSMVAPFASGFLIRVYQESTLNTIVSSLHRSQSLSLDGKGNTEWGICKTGNIIRVYQGSCASPTIKEDSIIPATVAVTGLSDITFSRVTGEPSSTLSIVITSGAGTNNISLNTLGVVDVN